MKHTNKLIGVAITSFVLVGALFLQNVLAATGTLYVTPGSTSVKNGSNFNVAVRLNPGTAVDSVSAKLTYDTAKLTYAGISYSGSPFTTQFPNISAGSIQVDSTILGGSVSTDALVATVTFTAKVGSGSGTLSLTGNAYTAGVASDPSVTGGGVSFTTPPTPTPTPTPTTPKPTTPTPTKPVTPATPAVPTTNPAIPASPATIKPPVVKETKTQYTVASMTVASDVPTRMHIRYGLTKETMNMQTAPTDLGTSHNLSLDPKNLVPGQKFYYVAVAQDAQGGSSQTEVLSFTTKGLSAAIGVFDKNHKPVAGKKVTLHSDPQTVKTDKNGFAMFSNVAAGTHSLEYTAGNTTYKETVEIANNVQTEGEVQTAATQNLSVVYAFEQSDNPFTSAWFLTLLLLVLVGAAAVVLVRRRNQYPALASVSSEYQAFTSEDKSAAKGKDEILERLQNLPGSSGVTPGHTITPTSSSEKNDKEA